MRRFLHFPALLLLAALLAPGAFADTLLFKDGRKLDGTILEEDADTVTFKVKSIVTKFKKADIEKIERGPAVDTPKDEGDAPLRALRIAPVGIAKLDALRTDAGKALDGVAEKRKALAAAAKKIDSQTRAYESQLRKVQAAEAEMQRSKDRLADAEAKLKVATDRLQAAKDQTGREPGPLKQEVQEASAKADSVRSTNALALRTMESEKKKLDEETDRFQMAAETLRPSVAALSSAYDALDVAWAALASEEKRQMVEAPWWPAPADAARVRFEGRVVACEKGALLVKTGADVDPAKWTEELEIAAPGFEAAKGATLLIVARRDKAGWILVEARR